MVRWIGWELVPFKKTPEKAPLPPPAMRRQSTKSWRILWTIQSVQCLGSERLGHDWATLTLLRFMNQKASSDQSLNLQVPWSWAPQAPPLWETMTAAISHPVYGILLWQSKWTRAITIARTQFECYFYLNGDFSNPAFNVTLFGHCELAISSIYYTVLSHCFGNDNTVF